MSELQSNRELVAVGHQLAKALSSDTPIIDIAKILSRLAERLDCTTAALRETVKPRDALAAGHWASAPSVNLPGRYVVRSGHLINESERGVKIPKQGG